MPAMPRPKNFGKGKLACLLCGKALKGPLEVRLSICLDCLEGQYDHAHEPEQI